MSAELAVYHIQELLHTGQVFVKQVCTSMCTPLIRLLLHKLPGVGQDCIGGDDHTGIADSIRQNYHTGQHGQLLCGVEDSDNPQGVHR